MGMETIYKLSVLVNMIDRVSSPMSTIQRAVGTAQSGMMGYQDSFNQMARGGATMMGAGAAMARAATLPIQATFDTQNAIGELSSLGVKDLQALENAATSFSSTWAGTTKADFLTAAYDIKSGIASLSDVGVSEMSRIAGVTAKATKSTVTEMTSLFATGYGIYKDYYSGMSDQAFGEMFSSGIAKSVQQFKTTGSGMAQVISALGGSATAASVPMEEQLAILGMLQATMSGSEAGTKYTAFLQSAAKAGGDLGLKFTSANGQLKSMPEILGLLKGKFGDTLTAANKLELQKAFGTVEAIKLIDLLYGKTDDLQGNIVTLYDTMGQGMKITEEMANKINAPPGQQWIVMLQRLKAVVEDIGTSMLPTFEKFMSKVESVTVPLADWVSKNSELAGSIMSGIAVFGMLLGTLGALKFLVGGVGSAILNAVGIVKGFGTTFMLLKDCTFYTQYGLFLVQGALSPLKSGMLSLGGGIKTLTTGMFAWVKQGIISAATALPGLIASVWSFTAALLANPITWVVIAAVALIAALVLLWQNWDTVVQWFTTGFQKILGWFTSMPDWVQGLIAVFMPFIGIPLLIVEHWDSIKAFFVGLIDWFKNIGASIMQGFTTGIQSFLNSPFEAVKGALEKVRSLLPFSDAKAGPLSDLTLSGSRVFSTFNDGMMQTADLPANTVDSAFGKAELEPETSGTVRGGKTTIIQKVVLYIKPDDIKDLQKLKNLLEECEELSNSNIGFDPVPAL